METRKGGQHLHASPRSRSASAAALRRRSNALREAAEATASGDASRAVAAERQAHEAEVEAKRAIALIELSTSTRTNIDVVGITATLALDVEYQVGVGEGRVSTDVYARAMLDALTNALVDAQADGGLAAWSPTVDLLDVSARVSSAAAATSSTTLSEQVAFVVSAPPIVAENELRTAIERALDADTADGFMAVLRHLAEPGPNAAGGGGDVTAHVVIAARLVGEPFLMVNPNLQIADDGGGTTLPISDSSLATAPHAESVKAAGVPSHDVLRERCAPFAERLASCEALIASAATQWSCAPLRRIDACVAEAMKRHPVAVLGTRCTAAEMTTTALRVGRSALHWSALIGCDRGTIGESAGAALSSSRTTIGGARALPRSLRDAERESVAEGSRALELRGRSKAHAIEARKVRTFVDLHSGVGFATAATRKMRSAAISLQAAADREAAAAHVHEAASHASALTAAAAATVLEHRYDGHHSLSRGPSNCGRETALVETLRGVECVRAFIGGEACTKLVLISDTELECTVPPGVGAARSVVVIAAKQPSAPTTNHAIGTVSYRAPTVLRVTPGSGAAAMPTILGAPSASSVLTIYGRDFGATDTHPVASIGRAPCERTVWLSDTMLECVVNLAPRQAGAQSISVVVAGQTSNANPSRVAFVVTRSSAMRASSSSAHLVAGDDGVGADVVAGGGGSTSTVEEEGDVLDVTSATPSHVPPFGGMHITLNGRGFRAPMVVWIGSRHCSNVSVVSEVELMCATPRGFGRGNPVVVGRGDVRSRAMPLIDYDAPWIRSIIGVRGAAAGGVMMRLRGVNLGPAVRVLIGARGAEFRCANERTMHRTYVHLSFQDTSTSSSYFNLTICIYLNSIRAGTRRLTVLFRRALVLASQSGSTCMGLSTPKSRCLVASRHSLRQLRTSPFAAATRCTKLKQTKRREATRWRPVLAFFQKTLSRALIFSPPLSVALQRLPLHLKPRRVTA